MRSLRRGFSVFEIVVAFTLLTAAAAVAIPSFQAFQTRGDQTALRVRQLSFQVDLAEHVASTPYVAAMHTAVPAPSGTTFVDGATASTSENTWSVTGLDTDSSSTASAQYETVVVTAAFNGGCALFQMSSLLDADVVFAFDPAVTGPACRAANGTIVTEISTAVGTPGFDPVAASFDKPLTIDIG